MAIEPPDQTPPVGTPGVLNRIVVAMALLGGLRLHDLRAPRTYIARMYPGVSLPVKFLKFAGWVVNQLFPSIPEALATVTFERPVSRTPIWLAARNPVANYPGSTEPGARLPGEEVAVIGAGFTGGAFAYHRSRHGAG